MERDPEPMHRVRRAQPKENCFKFVLKLWFVLAEEPQFIW
jgi:hypothetical protein